MKRARKLLALLLLLVFAVAAIPTMAFAADPDADGNLTVTIPYTTAVQKGGKNAPGIWAFALTPFEFAGENASEDRYPDLHLEVFITTTGAGEFQKEFIISGPAEQVHRFMDEGFLVRQESLIESDSWTFSGAVYHIALRPVELDPSETTGDSDMTFAPVIHATSMMQTDNGTFYSVIGDPLEKMNFGHIYTDDSAPITVEFPFTKVVKQGDNTAPGKQTFELEVFDENTPALFEDITFKAAAETDGAGSFNGVISVTGPRDQVESFLSEGALLREKKGTAAGWTYSDAVWAILVGGYDAEEDAYLWRAYPAHPEHNDEDNTDYYVINEDEETDKIVFENTYTKNTPPPSDNGDNGGNGGSGDPTPGTVPPAPSGNGSNTTPGTVTPAATGDSSHRALWVLLVLSALTLCGSATAVVYKKRHA